MSDRQVNSLFRFRNGKPYSGNDVPDFLIFWPEMSYFGGYEKHFVNQVKAFRDRGHRLGIVSYYDNLGLWEYADDEIEVFELRPIRHPFAKAWALRRFIRYCAKRGRYMPLLIGVQAAAHASMFSDGGYYLRVADTPSLGAPPAEVRGPRRYWRSLRKRLFDGFVKRGYRRAIAVSTDGEYQRREMKELYGVDAAVFRVGSLDPAEFFHRRCYRPGERLEMLSVSRIEWNKRVDWMLQALAALRGRSSHLSDLADWRLHVVGSGSQLEQMKLLSAELGLDDNVQFHGFLPEADLAELYRRAQLFLMPALQGYGVPALEALAQGLCVVLHRQSIVSEILHDIELALDFDGDCDDFARTLDEAVGRITVGLLEQADVPDIPTEATFAADLMVFCRWQAAPGSDLSLDDDRVS